MDTRLDTKTFEKVIRNIIFAASDRARLAMQKKVVTVLIDQSFLEGIPGITKQEAAESFKEISSRVTRQFRALKNNNASSVINVVKKRSNNSILVTFTNHSAAVRHMKKVSKVIEEVTNNRVGKDSVQLNHLDAPIVVGKAVDTSGVVARSLGFGKERTKEIQKQISVLYKVQDKIDSFVKLTPNKLSVEHVSKVVADAKASKAAFKGETVLTVAMSTDTNQALGNTFERSLNRELSDAAGAIFAAQKIPYEKMTEEYVQTLVAAIFGDTKEAVPTINKKTGKITNIRLFSKKSKAFYNPFRIRGFKDGKDTGNDREYFSNMATLRQAIEGDIPSIIQSLLKNKGSDTGPNHLVNRTYNFARETAIVGLPRRLGRGKDTGITIPFNYESSNYSGVSGGHVYRQFEKGNAQGSEGRDPRRIIGEAIRTSVKRRLGKLFSSSAIIEFRRGLEK